MADPTTKPGDLVGHDSTGRVRIDRVVPLQWVLTILGVVAAQAATLWFQVQSSTESIKEMRVDLRAMTAWQSQSLVKDAETSHRLRDLERRIELLEVVRKQP